MLDVPILILLPVAMMAKSPSRQHGYDCGERKSVNDRYRRSSKTHGDIRDGTFDVADCRLVRSPEAGNVPAGFAGSSARNDHSSVSVWPAHIGP
jgi:hypothetical protein